VEYPYKTEPYAHQREAFEVSRTRKNFALLMDQGTGKSKVAIDTAAFSYLRGAIDAVLVVVVNGVHKAWIAEQFPEHLPDEIQWRGSAWRTDMNKKERTRLESVFDPEYKGLRVLSINLETFSHKDAPGKRLARRFLDAFRVFFILDEASGIKAPGAKRTASLIALGKHAVARRILTGTLVTEAPLDVYAPMKFLDWRLMGFRTYSEFKTQYAVTEQATRMRYDPKTKTYVEQSYEDIVGFKNIPDLRARLYKHAFRVRKEDCLDLPEKVYVRRRVELSKEQRRMYREMLEESVTQLRIEARRAGVTPPPGSSFEDELMYYVLAGETLEENLEIVTILAKNAAVRFLRLQQILGGFFPGEEPVAIPGPNPRLKSLLDLIAEESGKVIIWARFVPELHAIQTALEKAYGEGSVAPYHGGVKARDRDRGYEEFIGKAGPDSEPVTEDQFKHRRFFVGQQRAGGYGLTLVVAKTMVYYSNDPSGGARLQSEDRAHRIGQRHNLTICDMEAENTVDSRLLSRLEEKKYMTHYILDSDDE
jgi:SNF2 family DNA or RNA helicase